MFSRFGVCLCSYFVEIFLRFGQGEPEFSSNSLEAFRIISSKQQGRFWIPQGNCSGQGQNPVLNVSCTPSSQSCGPAHIANIVAAVIQNSQELSEFAQPIIPCSKARADFKHGPCIFARDSSPILYAQGPSP